ncbi:MAG: hypothetical protein HY825_20385 [Acidobacteria bacterium]|nr:hypothetical protein [Acidobacteriota bacterium]
MTPKQAIQRYLRTGDADHWFPAWPGDVIAAGERGWNEMAGALVAEVQKRTVGRPPPCDLPELDLPAFTRRKVAPMVGGLFRLSEQETVLAVLERSVVFLVPDTIEQVIRGQNWPRSAWDLANIFLGSLGAKLLSRNAPSVVGMSEERTCYVSMEYFATRQRFADFVVHEAAHVFHNCKRLTVGLPETRTKEWLLDIAFQKREIFAHACEAYSRILEFGTTAAQRRVLLEELAAGPMPCDETVSGDEYLDILREAAAARNGWKRILARCAPPKRAPRQERLA